MKPLLLDLFCCAGGAARGYHRAGFDVIGVDIVDRPNYPFTFVKADALRYLGHLRLTRPIQRMPDLIHASPPCQEGNALSLDGHPQLVPPTRERLDALGLPYVIEQPTTNRPGLIRRDLTLCMDMFYAADFPPPWVQRHRSFELSGFTVPVPAHVKHRGYVRGHRHGVVRSGPYVAAYGAGGGKATVVEMRHAMGIDWTDVREELTEAIPPAYTEHIGRAFLASMRLGLTP